MANEFEFELAKGQKIYTGMKMPETRPLLFAESGDQPFSIEDAAEIIKDRRRKRARDRFSWILNQGQRSSCNAYATAAALMKLRIALGHEHVDLAPEFLYALINGDKDQGSLLPDAMEKSQSHGMPRRDLVAYESYQQREMSPEATEDAKRFRVLECQQMPTKSVESHWAMICSCILRDQFVNTARHVGRNGMEMDQQKIIGFSRGPGNHAVNVDDVSLRTENPKSWEDFVVEEACSWGKKVYDNGRGYLTIQHSVEPMKWHATFAFRSVRPDPKADNPTMKRS